MPKKRKTRKQKILNEQKRQVVHETLPSVELSEKQAAPLAQQPITTQGLTFSLPTNYNTAHSVQKEKKPVAASVVISTNEYGYIGKDLMRTALLSAAIVLAEMLIKMWFRG